MHPILFEWGPIRIGSYGVLLALAFTGSIVVTNREFRKNNLELDLAWDIYLLAILGGLIGSKILDIFENWADFMNNPVKIVFSTTGFSVIGGYILAISLCAIRVRMAKQPFIKMADVCAPGMAIGYAIGRLGCIAAGDGCYGIPTLCFMGMTFPNGLVPTLSAQNLYLKKKFVEFFPTVPVPVDIPVHPAPLYESISQWILLAILLFVPWKLGRGYRFAFFLGWFGISRFLIEFIRLNPSVMFGLSSGQLLSIFFVACSLFLVIRGRNYTNPI